MFRLSKITDYGIVLLAQLARQERDGGGESGPRNARELAAAAELPDPVVSKVLKALARGGLVESHRGAKGGYRLARRPEEITVAEMITALDGPVALTECSVGPATCQHEGSCAVRSPWQILNRVVHYALASVTLADLINPAFIAQLAPLELVAPDEVQPGEMAQRPLRTQVS